jgi:hypothetical protein
MEWRMMMTERERLVDLLTDVLGMSIGAKADHLLDNGVTFHKWVPTALGFFPEEYGRYLCVVRSFAFPGCFYQTILQYDNYGFREGNIYTDDVAYWMPLPEPPKEE